MGQFKPMVKMNTTEPSVILKLAKGGMVKSTTKMSTAGSKKMANGGALSMLASTPALVGRPVANASVRTPGKPSMAMRRKAMAEGGESMAEHKAEKTKMASLKEELKSHKSKPASKAHKGLKTGGVAKGNAGGYATGGVALGNAGGFKKGGAPKKAFAAGGVVDSGAPVAMPQGRKKPSAPVSINQLSGTFKSGGSVTPAQKRLQKVSKQENASAMKAAKANSNESYRKMANGGMPGDVPDEQTLREQRGYETHRRLEREENQADRDLIFNIPKRIARGVRNMFSPKTPKGSVTETKESVTVAPAKKRGGAVC